MKNYKKGFTLIELLVVIAIIGILSSVVLASLNSARSKGSDGAVKANLTQVRSQAQMYYDDNGNYGTAYVAGVCSGATGVFADNNVVNQISAAKTAAGATSFNSCASIDNDGDGNGDVWAVAQQLKSDTSKFWCADSMGAAKEFTGTGPDYDQIDADAAVAGGSCQ